MTDRIEILESILSQQDQAKYEENTVYFKMVEKWEIELKKLKMIQKVKGF
ncbi:hypothetical protein [Colwellia sp. MB3u-55]|jgi:hypothetical protein|nr:hypothetical protein [Colwellia sp. MB3u-55]MBA6252857.1 hypothetical protein [Colwellia sp. MB3u-55]